MGDSSIRRASLVMATFVVAAVLSGHLWHLLASNRGVERPESSTAIALPTVEAADTVHLAIPPGWRAEQVAAAVDAADVGDRARFLELVQKPGELIQPYSGVLEGPTLEGYLAPGTYTLKKGAREEDLIRQMLVNFSHGYTEELRHRASELGMSTRQVITLASIVEKEQGFPSDAPIIAGVFRNRLIRGMPLQSDPTVVYAVESARPPDPANPDAYWQLGSKLTVEDLATVSPYSTYLTPGLPPGPISSPSIDTIKAVLFFARTDWLYFYAKDNGASYFASTLQERDRSVQEQDKARSAEVVAAPLQSLVDRVAALGSGHVGVVVKNLATGEAAFVNADDHFSMGTLSQLVTMAAAYDQKAKGSLSFDEQLTIALGKDPPQIQERLGGHPTIAQALELMAVANSNDAGVALLDRLGPRSVTDFAQRGMGMSSTWLDTSRPITTPRDLALLLEGIALGRGPAPEVDSKMVEALLRQTVPGRLQKYLAQGTSLAHKPGDLGYPSHDAGILFTSRGKVVLVAMTEATKNPEVAAETIAQLGRFVQQYFEQYLLEASRQSPQGCAQSPFRGEGQGRLVNRTIMLDPGHGGSDPGAFFTFPDGSRLTEAEENLAIALRLRDLLVAEGARVYMTRCQDADISLMARAAVANAMSPDLFLSLHLNASADETKDGTEVYYFSGLGLAAANYILGNFAVPALWQKLDATTPLVNDGVHFATFTVLVFTTSPSALTEAVHISNRAEAAALRDGAASPGGRLEQIAQGHLKGIIGYLEGAGALPGQRVLMPSLPKDVLTQLGPENP